MTGNTHLRPASQRTECRDICHRITNVKVLYRFKTCICYNGSHRKQYHELYKCGTCICYNGSHRKQYHEPKAYSAFATRFASDTIPLSLNLAQADVVDTARAGQHINAQVEDE